ncbi:hypothetical protein EPT53_08080 [Fusobacterium necrophorum]|uniref:Uncharacterized protein n=1 Tax=Fusobacterium necrophorum TaxID=859 RepID=A0A4Q2KZ80_9FUSO|nr:hypothetical protein [Fusobacterium necrophorum]RXZ68961.1 hypothetical protein EPT53_08080 [Fusobacterium necrophorum]
MLKNIVLERELKIVLGNNISPQGIVTIYGYKGFEGEYEREKFLDITGLFKKEYDFETLINNVAWVEQEYHVNLDIVKQFINDAQKEGMYASLFLQPFESEMEGFFKSKSSFESVKVIMRVNVEIEEGWQEKIGAKEVYDYEEKKEN